MVCIAGLSDNLLDPPTQPIIASLRRAAPGYKLAQLLFASSERKSSLSSCDLLVVILLLPREWLRCHSGWKQQISQLVCSHSLNKQEIVSFTDTLFCLKRNKQFGLWMHVFNCNLSKYAGECDPLQSTENNDEQSLVQGHNGFGFFLIVSFNVAFVCVF